MMTGRSSKRPNPKDNFLADALYSFNSTLCDLGSSYEELKNRIQELNLQISEKNIQLEQNFFKVNRLRWFFDSILNSMADGVAVVDTSGKIVLFNRGAEKLTGFSSKQVLGKSYTEVFGKLVSERFSPLYTLKEGVSLLLEEKEMPKKSGEKVPVRYSTSLVTDSQGRTLGAVEVFSDLTQIKQLEGEMQRTKTQTALNQMAALVAHEIRNPLGGIRGYVDLLAESLEKDDPRRKMVNHINESINSLDAIVANFQLFTRPVKPNFESSDIIAFLNEVLDFFKKSANLKEKSIQLVLNGNASRKPLYVRMDPILMEQAILAVLDNAVKAMKMGGTIRIEIQKGKPLCKGSKKHVSIVVSDSGEGMSRQTLRKLFTPFFTTRERGMGLGLALAKNFIHLHQGDIFVESEKGVGTTVTILLPKN